MLTSLIVLFLIHYILLLLLFIFKLEWIWVEWSQRWNRCLFWELREILLFGEHRKIGASVNEVYRANKDYELKFAEKVFSCLDRLLFNRSSYATNLELFVKSIFSFTLQIAFKEKNNMDRNVGDYCSKTFSEIFLNIFRRAPTTKYIGRFIVLLFWTSK